MEILKVFAANLRRYRKAIGLTHEGFVEKQVSIEHIYLLFVDNEFSDQEGQ